MSYVRGKYARASVALIDEMKRRGVVATVGYARELKERGGRLEAYVRAEHVFKVPREWQGFSVTVHVDNTLVEIEPPTTRGLFAFSD